MAHLLLQLQWVNDSVCRQSPLDAIHFGGTIRRFTTKIVNADLSYGPVFISKLNLINTYMRVWFCPKDLPCLIFVIPDHPSDPYTLIVFHLSLQMEYVEFLQLFCTMIETVTNITNISWPTDVNALPHPLDLIAYMHLYPTNNPAAGCPSKDLYRDLHNLIRGIPPQTLFDILKYVDVYMDNFCALSQGSVRMYQQSWRHLFNFVDLFFHPKDTFNTTRQESNSIKNLMKVYSACSTNKKMPEWLVDSLNRVISLPSAYLTNNILDLFPQTQQRTFRRRCHRLLGALRSMVIDIFGSSGRPFFRVQMDLSCHG